MNRESANIADKAADQRVREAIVSQVQDILDNIIAKGILNQGESVIRDLANELQLLRNRSVVNASLKHAASMAVGGHLDTVGANGVVDELVVLRGEAVEALLDDMIAVQVLDQSHHAGVQGHNNNRDLLRRRQELNHFLNSSCAVHVQRNVDQLRRNSLNNGGALLVTTELEEFLAQVVAKRVYIIATKRTRKE